MAKIASENIQITLSKIVKDTELEAHPIVDSEIISAIEQVVQELAGETIVVEVGRV